VHFAGTKIPIPYWFNYSSLIADNIEVDSSYFDHNQITAINIGSEFIISNIIVNLLSSVNFSSLHRDHLQTHSCQIFD